MSTASSGAGRSAVPPGEVRAELVVTSPAESASAPAQAPARRIDRRIAKLKDHHLHSLHAIRHFLRTHSSYDVLPVSFRLVVFDTQLTIKSALDVMFQSGMFARVG